MLRLLGFLFLSISAVTSIKKLDEGYRNPQKRASLESFGSFRDCLNTKLGASNSTSLSSKIIFPGDALYSLSTLTYNLAIRHNSSAIVYADASTDVSKAIECASTFKVPVVARGGGLSYASFSSASPGLIIDVSNLRSFSFATNHLGQVGELVTFGAGLRLGDLELALQDHEKAIPHGICPYVGVSGHATCGGFGPTSRIWGLFSDQITELEVVTANGTILKASDELNSELFYAMRGAGPSFGIITSLTLRTHQAPRNVILFEINYRFSNAEQAGDTLHKFQSWGLKSAPSQLGIRWAINITYPSQNSGKVSLNWNLRGSYLGHFGRFNRTIARLEKDFKVRGEFKSLKRFTWIESVGILGGDEPLSSEGVNPSNYNATYYAKSFIVRDSNLLTYSQWIKFATTLFDLTSGLKPVQKLLWFTEIDLVGGSYQGQPTAVRGVTSKTSSFGPRDALLLFQIAGYGPPGASLNSGNQMDLIKTTSNKVYESLGGGQKELTGYNCYVDSEFSAERAHREYFGTKITQTLKSLKNVWDPSRVFNHPHGF